MSDNDKTQVVSLKRHRKENRKEQLVQSSDERYGVYGETAIDEKGEITFFATRRVNIKEGSVNYSKYAQLGSGDLSKILAEHIRAALKLSKDNIIKVKVTGYNNIYPFLQVLDRIPSLFPDSFKSERLVRIINTDVYIVGSEDVLVDGVQTKKDILESKVYFGLRAIIEFKGLTE